MPILHLKKRGKAIKLLISVAKRILSEGSLKMLNLFYKIKSFDVFITWLKSKGVLFQVISDLGEDLLRKYVPKAIVTAYDVILDIPDILAAWEKVDDLDGRYQLARQLIEKYGKQALPAFVQDFILLVNNINERKNEFERSDNEGRLQILGEIVTDSNMSYIPGWAFDLVDKIVAAHNQLPPSAKTGQRGGMKGKLYPIKQTTPNLDFRRYEPATHNMLALPSTDGYEHRSWTSSNMLNKWGGGSSDFMGRIEESKRKRAAFNNGNISEHFERK